MEGHREREEEDETVRETDRYRQDREGAGERMR